MPISSGAILTIALLPAVALSMVLSGGPSVAADAFAGRYAGSNGSYKWKAAITPNGGQSYNVTVEVYSARPACSGKFDAVGEVRSDRIVTKPEPDDACVLTVSTNGNGIAVQEKSCEFDHGVACMFTSRMTRTGQFEPPSDAVKGSRNGLSAEAVVRTMYSRKAGDVRRFLSPSMRRVHNSASPDSAWMYGGFYPDSPRIKITVLGGSAQQASVQVDVDIESHPHLRRTIHLTKAGNTWSVDRVQLDQPEQREIP